MTPHTAVLNDPSHCSFNLFYERLTLYIYPIKVCLKWEIKFTKRHSSHGEVGRWTTENSHYRNNRTHTWQNDGEIEFCSKEGSGL